MCQQSLRPHFLVHRLLGLLQVLTWQRMGQEALWGPFSKSANPIHEGSHPHDLITSWKSLLWGHLIPSNTATLRDRAPRNEVGADTNIHPVEIAITFLSYSLKTICCLMSCWQTPWEGWRLLSPCFRRGIRGSERLFNLSRVTQPFAEINLKLCLLATNARCRSYGALPPGRVNSAYAAAKQLASCMCELRTLGKTSCLPILCWRASHKQEIALFGTLYVCVWQR